MDGSTRLVAAIGAAVALLSWGCAADAASIVTFTVSGAFDSVDPGVSPNKLSGLVGAPYTLSVSLGASASTLIRTQTDPDETTKGWFFDTHSSLTTTGGHYTQAQTSGGVVASVTNDFVYDGSEGLLPAGVYDIIDITGWRRGTGPVVDPAACPNPSGGSLLGDATPGPCSLAGTNTAVDLKIIGSSSLVKTLNGIPFGDLDLSQVDYIQTDVRAFNNGFTVGDIGQDPPVTYHDGVLTGPGLTASVLTTSVPEPAGWALMLSGFSMAGAAIRRRRRAEAVS